ncbi:PIN domain-containing protein, partial [Kibdelosporangium lantanae]
LDTGQILGAKDPHARQRPASLIKVLLSLVVLDELGDKMDKVITGTAEDASQDGTRVGIGPGGQYTVRQLFYTLLMRSGNDCAHALAMQMGGIEQTVAKMNAKAKSLDALDTQTATPSGLDGPGMMTSAFDLAVFFREAMRNPEFAKAVATKQLDMPGYGDKPGFKVNNDNGLLGKYQGFLGGKTGFTDDARHTYVLDTSVLLSDPWSMTRFAEHSVVLPLVVISELEGKRHHPELGWFARSALRMLDDLGVGFIEG